MRLKRQLSGFTLNELIVVLIIIGVLVLIAVPSLMPLITKAKSTEAKLQLKHVYLLEESHFFEKSVYAGDLKMLGFEQQKLVTEGGDANYIIEIVQAGPSGYSATATAVVDFDQDGVYNVWQINETKELLELTPD